jgi:hypothetical protein
MMSDMIIDFDAHLKNNQVYLAEVYLPLQDAPEDVPHCITADVYVVANSSHQALYIAHCMYPDNDGVTVDDEPVTEYEYAARRNRGIL